MDTDVSSSQHFSPCQMYEIWVGGKGDMLSLPMGAGKTYVKNGLATL